MSEQEKMQKTLSEKLRETVDKTGKKHYEIADEISVSKGRFSRWLKNPEKIDSRYYSKLEKALGCSLTAIGFPVSDHETSVKPHETRQKPPVKLLSGSQMILDAYLQKKNEGASDELLHMLLDAFTLSEKERKD